MVFFALAKDAYLAVASDGATDPHLTNELGLEGVCDVVLPDVSVKPVGEIQELVVERQQEVGNQSRHVRESPSFNAERFHGDGSVSLPLATLVSVEVLNGAAECCSNEPVNRLWIVREANFERNQAFVSKVNLNSRINVL